MGIGGAFTPPAIAWMMTHFGWRTPLVVCGLVGPVVAAIWHRQSTENPAEHPGVSADELAVANFMLDYVNHPFYTLFFVLD